MPVEEQDRIIGRIQDQVWLPNLQIFSTGSQNTGVHARVED